VRNRCLPQPDINRARIGPTMNGAEVRQSSFGGFGLFATRCYKENEEICAESPFLSIVGITNCEGNPHNHWSTTPQEVSDSCDAAVSISHAVHELSADNKKKFWEFSQSPVYGEKGTAHGIFYTNYIDVTPQEGPDVGCMFQSICRVNHSCKPNACWIYNQNEGHLALHASRAVQDGDELLVDYCGHEDCDEWCRIPAPTHRHVSPLTVVPAGTTNAAGSISPSSSASNADVRCVFTPKHK
jgi:hypothetical protein